LQALVSIRTLFVRVASRKEEIMTTRIGTWMRALAVIAVLAIPGRAAAQHQRSALYPYVLIDLGTFGGPHARVDQGDQPLNARGALIGQADTSTTDPHAPNCPFANPDCFVFLGFVWEHGILTRLASLPGGSSNFPFAINASGLIAGASLNGVVNPLTDREEARAVLWRGGQTLNLGTLPGGSESNAFAVNDRGQVTGPSSNAIPDPYSCAFFICWGTQTRAFLWQNGTMQDLGTLGGPDSLPLYLNDRGQIAGVSYTTSTPNAVTGQPTQDPFLWESGHMRDLGSLGGTLGGPNGMNSQGAVVGQSDLAGDQTFHPFLWEDGPLHDLGTLGGDFGSAGWIADSGAIAGWATLPGNTTAHAVLWRHGSMTDLGTVPGQPCSFASSLNDVGQVVGGSCTSDGNGWLWDHGTITDLNTLVAPSALHLAEAQLISDRGEIVVNAILPNGDQHVAVLIPAWLAALEGLTPNAPPPGSVLPVAMTRPRAAPCTNLPQWRTLLVRGHHRPCFGS
jgi:probable HAF family extracellular repeat protein